MRSLREGRRTSIVLLLPILLLSVLARRSLGTTPPPPGLPQTPIEHVVIVNKENRSFDHYFGEFPGVDGATQGQIHTGEMIDLWRAPDSMPNDIGHDSDAFFTGYNGGLMNGFDLVGGAISEDGEYLAYSQMEEDQIPSYWAYARTYAIGDAMFSDFHGASFANNTYMVAGQTGEYEASTGFRSIWDNPVAPRRPGFPRWGCDDPPDSTAQMVSPTGQVSRSYPCFNFPALPNILHDYGVSWRFYSDKDSGGFVHNTLNAIRSVRYDSELWSNVVPFGDFYTDAAAGTLPAVSWVLGQELEHPPTSTCQGENETVSLLNAIMQGPNWDSTAVFVFWDEWGGFYDHVPPPQVDIRGYGARMPLLVISPWTKWGESSDGGYISHTFYSHASYLAHVGTNWSLPPITPRVGSANDMMDIFDFAQAPKPPLIRDERTCAPLTPEARALAESEDPD